MKPTLILRLEGLGLLLLSLLIYKLVYEFPWSWLALGLLAPDLGALGYLVGKRAGAWCYNLTHTTVFPLALILFFWWAAAPAWQAMPIIWLTHIGMDRALGYGLKTGTDFKETHLGRI